MDRAYLGPRPFGSGHADVDRFFGRANEAGALADWWQDNRLTFMVGPAGRGKTSLLNSGVLPMFAKKRLTLLPVGRLASGATFPVAALPPHNPHALAVLRSWMPGESPTRLAGQTIQQFLSQRPNASPVLAAIDPIDELLAVTGQRQRHRQNFLRDLSNALESFPQLHLLLVGREESVDLASATLGSGVRYDVPRLSEPEAAEAIRRPFAATGGYVDHEAAQETICSIADDGIDPGLLQIVCASLESALPTTTRHITVRDVRNHGDVDAALAAYLRTVIADIASDHDLVPRDLHSWLLGTFVTELGTKGKAYEGVTATAKMPNAVARALEDRQVLISYPESGTRWYELLSARLLRPLRELTGVLLPAKDPPDLLCRAEHALTIGELELTQRYATAITRDPGHRQQAAAHSLLGNIAVERSAPADAEEHYQQAMEHYAAVSDMAAVAYQLAAVGRTRLDQGKVMSAMEALHAATVRMPEDVSIRVAYAHALWQLGETHAAARELTMALNVDGGNPAALAARGEVLADLGEANQALLDLNRVSDQDGPRIHAARGLALATLRRLGEARQEADRALASGTQDGPALLYAARAAALTEDDFTAADLARRAIAAKDPPLPQTQIAAAQRLTKQGSRHLLAGRRPAF